MGIFLGLEEAKVFTTGGGDRQTSVFSCWEGRGSFSRMLFGVMCELGEDTAIYNVDTLFLGVFYVSSS